MRLACVSTHVHPVAPVRLQPSVALHCAQRRVPARRLRVCAPAARQPGRPDNSSSSGGSGPAKRGRAGSASHAQQPQTHLQAWLQQEQGLPAEAADQHACRQALVFGSQQAALDSLPATFEWCRSRGLTGLQTAQLLDGIAKKSHKCVVQFAALVQPVWQLMDSYVAAWAEQQQQAGDSRLRKHTSLAEALCGHAKAAEALGMPPGHVEAWLAAVSEQLPAAAVGGLLLGMPSVVCGGLDKGPAAISWAVNVLGVADPAAFFAAASSLLTRDVSILQRNLDSLRQALGCTAEQARQLVLKQPVILAPSPDTVQTALTWLRQLFPDAAPLAGIISRGPLLLTKSVQHLQSNADYLQQALGWQEGDSQLAAFVATYPLAFAAVDLTSKATSDKLRLLSEVVGVSTKECLTSGISYLKTGLETMAAHYVLVQARAPHLLFSTAGEQQLRWVVDIMKPSYLAAMGMTRAEVHAFVREWPRSEEGRRLLEGLRAGSVAGWPRPPVPGEAQRQQCEEAAQRRQARAARQQGRAATTGGKQRGRGRPRKAQPGSGGSMGDDVQRTEPPAGGQRAMARQQPSYERMLDLQQTRPPVEPAPAASGSGSGSGAQLEQQENAQVNRQVVLPAGEALMIINHMEAVVNLLLPERFWGNFDSQIAGRMLCEALLGAVRGSLSKTDLLQRICMLPPALQGAARAVIAEQAPTIVCRHADPADKCARPVVVFHGGDEGRQQVGQLLGALGRLRLKAGRQEAWERHSEALHCELKAAAAAGQHELATAIAMQLASRRVPLFTLHYQGLRDGERFAVRREVFLDASGHGKESYSTNALCLGPEVPLDNGWLPLPSFLPARMCHQAVSAPQGGGAPVKAGQLGWTWLANAGLGKDSYRVGAGADVFVDPASRTAVVDGGALACDVDNETALHGLAAPLGVCSVVGVGGLALNGGWSLLARAFGATADNILEATLVLADGSVVVVTGEGSAEEKADLLGPLRMLGPIRDTVGAASWLETQSTHAPAIAGLLAAFPEHYESWAGGHIAAEQLTEACLDELVRWTADEVPPGCHTTLSFVELLGGRLKDSQAPVGWQGDVQWVIQAGWTDPAHHAEGQAFTAAAQEALAPFCRAHKPYINMVEYSPDQRMGFDQAAQTVWGAANLERLRKVKQRVDPTNVFRHTPLAAVLSAEAGG
ncbi:FAD-linked oxidase [Chlorella sorokiniana]|uniref:FAD-linked oxidase n=1 Tax=Chlorella sorokiniana TaxID=3076 RepID=A0A2P6TNQ9_CHLSO|nr:FAD-linked oxidase [Chlorella sorokiniana]|eukprot:PRW50977.1 FAD-linked oxidase [Chlorella sorokiniana]